MHAARTLLGLALLVACSSPASNTPPKDEATLPPPPSSEPALSADAPPKVVRDKPVTPPDLGAAADKCLFCGRAKDGACEAPDVGPAQAAQLGCGALAQLRGVDARRGCDASCCLPTPKPGAKAQDRDADGVPDDLDLCPTEPEDADGFQDVDGCPDPDNDKDGIRDAEDKCCFGPEDADGVQDLDGCAEP